MSLPGIYSQRDARWSGLELGYNTDPTYNLYHFGCLVTAVANMLWYNGNPNADPGAVNQWLKDNNGFESGGGNMIWDALQGLLDQVHMVAHGYSSDLNAVNDFLQADNNWAIAWLTKPGFPMHWCVMPYVGEIADSWDGLLKSVSDYTFNGAHLFTQPPVVVPPPPVQPAPPSAPQPPIPTPPTETTTTSTSTSSSTTTSTTTTLPPTPPAPSQGFWQRLWQLIRRIFGL